MAIALVSLVAFLAGAVNAVAGGGTFLAFPSLIGLGRLNEKAANIACTIGLWPGSAASVAAARRQIKTLPRRLVVGFVALCLAGGALGAILLQKTTAEAFEKAIPWLLGFATLVFAMGPRVAKWAGRAEGGHSTGWIVFVAAVQFVIAVYGGYFGAGIGVLTLAGLSLLGMGDLQRVNALKVLMSTATNLAAAVLFLFGPVPWPFIGPMAAASTVGGFVGMAVAQRLSQRALRGAILTIGVALTAAYFWKAYGSR